MKPTPICEVLRRIKPLAPFHQAAHLRGLISCEKKRSLRRRELEEALKAIMNKQMRRENRAA
jgi:hypothetical protein